MCVLVICTDIYCQFTDQQQQQERGKAKKNNTFKPLPLCLCHVEHESCHKKIDHRYENKQESDTFSDEM